MFPSAWHLADDTKILGLVWGSQGLPDRSEPREASERWRPGRARRGFRRGACSAAGKEALGNSLQVSPSAQKGPGDAGTRCCSQGHRHKLQHGTAPRKQPFLCKQGIPGTDSEFVCLYCNCFDPINLPFYGLCHVAVSPEHCKAISSCSPMIFCTQLWEETCWQEA